MVSSEKDDEVRVVDVIVNINDYVSDRLTIVGRQFGKSAQPSDLLRFWQIHCQDPKKQPSKIWDRFW